MCDFISGDRRAGFSIIKLLVFISENDFCFFFFVLKTTDKIVITSIQMKLKKK